jgi:hypothetical protein
MRLAFDLLAADQPAVLVPLRLVLAPRRSVCRTRVRASCSVFVDVDGDVLAWSEVEVIEGIEVVEADFDGDDLGDFLEIAGALRVGLGEQEEHRGGASLDVLDAADDPGLG